MIRVIITRPTAMHGQRIEPGTTLELSALDASALVSNGKATLLDQSDHAPLRAALSEAGCCDARSQAVFGQSAEAAAQQLRDLERAGRPRGIGFILADRD